MDVVSLFEPILQVLWVSIRVAAFWISFPFVMSLSIPPMVRVASALTLSIALLPLVGDKLPQWTLINPPDTLSLVSYITKEFIIGIGLGFFAKFIFMSAIAAAEWVGTQIGFSVGGLVNPDFQESDTSWSALHGWIALMLYLGMGGHWFTMQALADSYSFSFGNFYERLTATQAGIQLWSDVGTSFFVWMIKLSGPMVAVILFIQAGMGVLSKFVPQINIWVVSIPVTIVVGILVFSMFLPAYGETLTKLFSAASETQYLWLRFLGAR